MPKLSPTPAPVIDPPPPAAADTSAGRAVVLVMPPGYTPGEYAETARAIAQHVTNWPTPAPQLAAILAAAVLQWARAQPD